MTVTRLAGVAFVLAIATSPAVAQPRYTPGPLFNRPALTGPGPGWRDRLEPGAPGSLPWSYYGLNNGPTVSVCPRTAAIESADGVPCTSMSRGRT